jgi:CRISPR associated protein Cas1/Domain of unknown function DUF83
LRLSSGKSDDYVMLSALQHFVYCPRQFALIHLEQVWEENIFTLRGLRVHERVDEPTHELIEGVRVELYVQSQGAYLQLDHETLKVKVEDVTKQVPLHHLGGIVAFGNVLFS